MYQTSNDLSLATRRSLSEMLNEHLADAIDLHLQAKQAHWNIKGPSFVGLHSPYPSTVSSARLPGPTTPTPPSAHWWRLASINGRSTYSMARTV